MKGKPFVTQKDFGPGTYWFRILLLSQVSKGNTQVLRIQNYRNNHLDRYFIIASQCGSELFYLGIMPFLYLVLDPQLARLTNYLFAFGVLSGNILKNLFCLPRPSSPPVWRPNKTDEILDCRDYGWPSTHSLNAVSLPLLVLYYFFGNPFTSAHSPLLLVGCYLFATLWAASIIWSRMYLGLHCPADVVGGILLGFFHFYVFTSYSDFLDMWILTSHYVPQVIIGFSIVLLVVHPTSNQTSYSYTESTCLLGWITGSILGTNVSASYFFGLFKYLSFSYSDGLFCFLVIPLLRYFLAIFMMATTYVITKVVLSKTLRAIKLLPNERIPHLNNDLTITEIFYKFVCYSSMGFVTASGLPLLFDATCRSLVGL